MRSSEATAELSKALVAAHLLLVNPIKTNEVDTGRFRYKYASLGQILDDVRPVLQAHGLVISQEAASVERGVGVTTRVIHTSGEWLEFAALVMPAGDAQATGSAITYARRYQLCAALGIAEDNDDDGAKASAVAQPAEPTAPTAERAGASSAELGTKAAPAVAVGNPSDDGDTTAKAGDGEALAAALGGAPSSDTLLADLLEAVGGSETKAINAVNKACHTAYKKADLGNLEADQYAAGLRVLA